MAPRGASGYEKLRPLFPKLIQPGTQHMGLSDISLAQATQALWRRGVLNVTSKHWYNPVDAPGRDSSTTDTALDLHIDSNSTVYEIPWLVSPSAGFVQINYIMGVANLATVKAKVRWQMATMITSMATFNTPSFTLPHPSAPPFGMWRQDPAHHYGLSAGSHRIPLSAVTLPADRLVVLRPQVTYATVSGTDPSTASNVRSCRLYAAWIQDVAKSISSF